MEDVQFEVITKKVNEVDEKLSRLDRDMATDRDGMDQFKVELSAVKEQQRQILDRVTKLDKRMKEAVADAVAQAIAPLNELLEEFNRKKVLTRTININPLVQWWEKIKGVKKV